MSARLRAGYKQTEVGVIPEDWEVVALGKHATFRTGPFGSALHKSDYTSEGVPVVNPMHIVDGKIEPTRTMTITEIAAKSLSEFRLKPGEIVIGRRGDMGRCAVVREHELGWLCGTGSMIIRPLKADAEFLQRVLSSPRAISAIEDTAVGTTMVNLNQSTLAGLKVQLPPISEQSAIAEALSDADALIESLDQLITKKRDLKQAAMQQLLTGQTRLPGFSGKWESQSLRDVSWFQEGPGVRTWQFTASGIKLLNGTNIVCGKLNLDSTGRFISESEANGAYSHFLADEGDIVIASSGITMEKFHEKVAIVSSVDLPFCMNTSTIRFKPREGKLAAAFLFHLLTGDSFKQAIGDHATGSAQLNFGPSHIEKVEIELPGFEEQTAIATILSDMDAELAELEARLAKARHIKQGMMQELLTGHTRLV